MKPDYSKRLMFILFVGLAMLLACMFFSPPTDQQPPPKPKQEQAVKTNYINTAPMLLYTDGTGGSVDWGEMSKQGIGSLIVIAVMMLVVSPLVKQMVDSNNKLADAVTSLNATISTGHNQIQLRILESENALKAELEERLCSMQRQIIEAFQSTFDKAR